MTAAEKKKAKKKAREKAKKAGGDADDAAAPTGPAKKGGKKVKTVCTQASGLDLVEAAQGSIVKQHMLCISQDACCSISAWFSQALVPVWTGIAQPLRPHF